MIPYHVLFKIIENWPDVKNLYGNINISVKHTSYPQEKMDKEWFTEVKTIANHQKCANFLSKKLKTRPKSKMLTLLDQNYLFQNNKIYNSEVSKLLELCYKYKTDLFHALYRIVLFKSLDMHFLLDQIFMITNIIENIEQNCNNNTILEVESAIHRLISWKHMVQPQNAEEKYKAKRKWNVNWRKRVKNLKTNK
jgi:hypothetical protein